MSKKMALFSILIVGCTITAGCDSNGPNTTSDSKRISTPSSTHGGYTGGTNRAAQGYDQGPVGPFPGSQAGNGAPNPDKPPNAKPGTQPSPGR